MSDGEHNATPDHWRASAPWERFSAPADRPAQDREGDTEKVGSHADGALSVSDLIAKIGSPTTDRHSHHRVADEADEPDEPTADIEPHEVASDVPGDLQDTQVIDAPAYSLELVSELPDLNSHAAANYPNDDADQDPAPKARRGRRPMLLAARSLAAVFAVLALTLTGGAWHWSTSKNNRLNTISALDPQSRDIVDPGGQYGDEDFLIVGMDSRAGANANMGAGDTQDADGTRSDTVMLVNIPANRKRVVAVSFPRDLAITPIQCEAWNPETGKYGPLYDKKTGKYGPRTIYTETKLNSTFSFGGPKCLVKEIQKLSGLSINRFIAIDFVGFARMVEALGGVEVCSTTPLQDYELGTVLGHSGRQVINGTTALNYVRARQVTTENNGDYGRIKRQQLFLSSLLRSLISEDTLLNLNKLNNVVNMFIGNSYVDNVKTKDLVQLGQSLQGMAAGHITFVTVPTGVTDQNGDEPPRTADMKALFAAIINDDPLPLENDHNAQSLGTSSASGPTATPSSPFGPPSTARKAPGATPEIRREQVTTTSPEDVTVQVSNATGQSGLAATATSQLKHNGFNVMTPDDYPSSLNATTVFFSPGNEQAAATVASSFANAKVARVNGIGQVVQVVLGPDFSSVSTPPPSGSSISVQIDHNANTPATKLPEDLTVTNAADTSCE
ncbi:MAG: LCP family protein [Mycobacterium sp.]|uniref:LCP family protein n=1 Tax=Mycobacterium sp. TaxID=1785 RepID=UPI003C3822F5